MGVGWPRFGQRSSGSNHPQPLVVCVWSSPHLGAQSFSGRSGDQGHTPRQHPHNLSTFTVLPFQVGGQNVAENNNPYSSRFAMGALSMQGTFCASVLRGRAPAFLAPDARSAPPHPVALASSVKGTVLLNAPHRSQRPIVHRQQTLCVVLTPAPAPLPHFGCCRLLPCVAVHCHCCRGFAGCHAMGSAVRVISLFLRPFCGLACLLLQACGGSTTADTSTTPTSATM